MQLKVHQAASHLAKGGVIAYPTEAVWGLGCDPFSFSAVDKLLTMKRRDPAKGLILVAANITQFAPFLEGLCAQQYQRLDASWPGPVTWLVPDNGSVPRYIKGNFDTIALRVSAHPIVRELCLSFGGPIVSTSANPANLEPAKQPLKVRAYFGQQLDFLLPGQLGQQSKPTEIRELLSGKVHRSA